MAAADAVRNLTAYLTVLVVFVSLNVAWVGLFAFDLYRRAVPSLLSDKPRLPLVLLFYLLQAGGILLLAVLPALASHSWETALLSGALLGLCTYGAYDLTNAATLRLWPGTLVAVDLAFGTVLTAVAATAGFLVAGWLGGTA